MKPPATYASVLLSRASQKSVVLTDQLSVLIVPFSTLVLWLAGAKMTDTIQETLALGVAMTVVTVVILRLIAASYFVWKDDQAEKGRLEKALEVEVARPDRLQREAARAHVIELRNRLGAALASLVSYAELRAKSVKGSEPFEALYAKDYVESFRQVRDLLNSLSYDVPLRVVCHELHHKCIDMIARGALSPKEDFQTLQSLKKIAFRLIFKEDSSKEHEMLLLLEAENLLGKMQYESGPVADLQRMIKDNPDMIDKLRANF